MNQRKLIFLLMTVFLTGNFIQTSDADIGTAFTYQGRLIDSNDLADGPYDFQFKLFDSVIDGNQVNVIVEVPDLNVIDGYFTVELDFGDNIFDGTRRWLEIGVRPGDMNDPNDYTPLSPRQEVTPTPYALYAKTSGSDNDWMVSGSDMYSIPPGNVGIGTTTLDAKLKVETETSDKGIYSFMSVTSGNQLAIVGHASGNAIPFNCGVRGISTSEIGDNYGVAAYAGLPSDGDNYGIYSYALNTGSGDAWAGAFNGSVYVENGNVGIGTKTPTGSLYSDSTTLEIEGNAPSIVLDDTAYTQQDDFEISNGGDKVLFRDANDGIDIMTLRLTGDTEGNVGIGTTDPEEKLDVNGNIHASGEITKSYTAGTSNPAAPVAYGFILFNGTIMSSTPNVSSVVWNAAQSRYEITISGEAYYYTDYVTVITLDGFSGMPITGSIDDKLYVQVRTPDDTGWKQSSFQFVTYKP